MCGRSAGLSSRMIVASARSLAGSASAPNAGAPLSFSSPAGRPPSWLSRLSSPAFAAGRGGDSGRGAAASTDLAPPRNAWVVRVNATPAAATAAARIACPAMSPKVSAPDFAAPAAFFLAFSVALFFVCPFCSPGVPSYQSPPWGRGSATNCGKKLTNGPQTSGWTPSYSRAHRADFLPQLPCSLGNVRSTEGAGGKGSFR